MANKKAVEVEVKVRRLTENNLIQAEYKRTIWHAEVTNVTELKDLLKSDYWAHVARIFKAGDRIEVVPADRSYFIELFVLASAKNWAKVVAIRNITLIDKKDTTEDIGFKVAWNGVEKWRITQGKEVISKDHDTKEAAETWLKNHKKEIQ